MMIKNNVVNVEIAFINSSLGYDEWLKTVLGVDRDVDGTFSRMGGSKFSMNTFRSSCFSVWDRKNLIAETKMQKDF